MEYCTLDVPNLKPETLIVAFPHTSRLRTFRKEASKVALLKIPNFFLPHPETNSLLSYPPWEENSIIHHVEI